METDKYIGKKFNRLTVLNFDSYYTSPSGKFKAKKYNFLCDCGNEKIITLNSVIYNLSKSCGCLHSENARSLGISNVKLDINDSAFNVYNRYKRNAKAKERSFNLTYDQFLNITSQNCYYCNEKPLRIMKSVRKVMEGFEYTYNGIDRVNSKIGYEIENCVPCCSLCNYMKNDINSETFVNQSIKIANFSRIKRGKNTIK